MGLQLDTTYEDFELTVKLEVSFEVDRDGLVYPHRVEFWLENKLLTTLDWNELPELYRYSIEQICRDEWIDYEQNLEEQAREAEWESRAYDEDSRIYPEKLK